MGVHPLRSCNDSSPDGADRILVTRAADVTMVPASSAQREPSMEEILASIRRIIEDNDTGRKPPEDGEAMRHSQEISRGGSISNGESSVIEVDAFRAELRGAAPAEPVDQRPSSRVEIFAARPQAPVVEKKPSTARPTFKNGMRQ